MTRSRSLDRRTFVRIASGMTPILLGTRVTPVRAGNLCEEIPDFVCLSNLGPWPVYRMGQEPFGPPVVVLHELPGLTKDDITLARRIAERHFTVYVPLLFGSPGQYRLVRGYLASCWSDFECSSPSTRSPILDPIWALCERIASRSGAGIGVIGMCLTGIFPLALVRKDRPVVQAPVLCQPTLPFTAIIGRPTGERKADLGLAPEDLSRALDSDVPILAMRYAGDKKCPEARMQAL